jgi:hypothetical protein
LRRGPSPYEREIPPLSTISGDIIPIFLTVGRDSKVVAIAKVDMGKALAAKALIIDKFFDAINESVQGRGLTICDLPDRGDRL